MNHQEINLCGFPITATTPLKKHGDYEDIAYEIVNHNRQSYQSIGDKWEYIPSNGTWCYYIVITEDQLPAEEFEQFWLAPVVNDQTFGRKYIGYDYNSAPFASVDWHCGVTYYEKLGGLDGNKRLVKIGCDYAHYWDEGQQYNLQSVEYDAIETIKQLQAMYHFYRRCTYTGIWRPFSEMIEVDGRLFSQEGKQARDDYLAERQAQK